MKKITQDFVDYQTQHNSLDKFALELGLNDAIKVSDRTSPPLKLPCAADLLQQPLLDEGASRLIKCSPARDLLQRPVVTNRLLQLEPGYNDFEHQFATTFIEIVRGGKGRPLRVAAWVDDLLSVHMALKFERLVIEQPHLGVIHALMRLAVSSRFGIIVTFRVVTSPAFKDADFGGLLKSLTEPERLALEHQQRLLANVDWKPNSPTATATSCPPRIGYNCESWAEPAYAALSLDNKQLMIRDLLCIPVDYLFVSMDVISAQGNVLGELVK